VHGFILSQHWRDTQNGMMLQYWLASDAGPVCLQFETQQTVCFCPQEQVEFLPNWPELSTQALDLKHFNQTPVSAVYCSRYQTLSKLRSYCQEHEISLWESEIKPTDRFLMERFIHGSLEFYSEQSISKKCTITDSKIKPSQYLPDLKVVSVDIETSMPDKDNPEKLYSIGFCGKEHNGQQEKRVFMLGDPALPHPAWLVLLPDTKSLLLAANAWLKQFDPDVIIGWNVVNFDFSVLDRIYREEAVEFNWARKGNVRLRQGNNNLTFADIPGRVIVDGIDALKNATYFFDSFSLQNVSEQLLGKSKNIEVQDGNMQNRGQAITDLFLDDKVALAKYNLSDCQLVLDIFEHTKILDYLIQRSHLTGHTLDRMGGSVAAFEYLYLPQLHRAGYIAPSLMEGHSDFKAPGGFVMDSQPGLYKHVLVLDFKSLYPSIIRTFKIDPMGLIEGLISHKNDESDNIIPGFHEAYFHREKHFLPDIITSLWARRDEAKQQKNAATSQAIKIIMNSFYGVLGSYGCRFFDARLASSITERSHDIIQKTALWIEQQGHQVIYGDTDSVFVHIKDNNTTQVQATNIGLALQDALNSHWTKTLKNEYNIESHLEIEFENHYKTFLMPTIRGSEKGSKKRYAGLDNSDKITFKGLEAVRSDWTPLAKELQTQLYDKIFHDKPYEDYLLNVANKLKAGLLDNKLIYRKRIRRALEHYQKNVPPQIQAARKVSSYYQALNLDNPYENGGWIEYVITLSGPEAIENIQSPLDYQHYLDKQMAPVADGILHFIGNSFHKIITPQQDIFF